MKCLYLGLWIMIGSCFLCLLIGVGCFVFVFVDSQSHTLESACTTPNGESASCQPWYNCTVVLRSLVNQEPFAQQFSEASKCGETPLVCCGSMGNFQNKSISTTRPVDTNIYTPTNNTKEAEIEFALKKLLPTTKYCGLQHTDDYFYDKNETSLDEFPWLVYIPFTNSSISPWHPGVKDIRCTGFLISNRYVITDRFCGGGVTAIEKVYIGQYNRDKNISCVESPYIDLECTEPLLEVKVTESIYADVESIYISNVRLLRLETKINYSDYVRPICLPLDESRRAKIGDTVVTSGWGATKFKDSEGKIKKRYKHTLENIELEGDTTTLMCGSPQNSNDTICQGDDGGPIMSSNRHQWFAEAVISLEDATIACNDPSIQTCGTRITPLTIEWILLNMKP